MCYTDDHSTAQQTPSSLSALAHEDKQQQVSNGNESHVFDNIESNTVQEPQKEMTPKEKSQTGTVMLEDTVFSGSSLLCVATSMHEF